MFFVCFLIKFYISYVECCISVFSILLNLSQTAQVTEQMSEGTFGDELLDYSVTDLDNGRFPLLTLLLLSVKESLWGFLNYCASFNLCLLPTLSLTFNIFIRKATKTLPLQKMGRWSLVSASQAIHTRQKPETYFTGEKKHLV